MTFDKSTSKNSMRNKKEYMENDRLLNADVSEL